MPLPQFFQETHRGNVAPFPGSTVTRRRPARNMPTRNKIFVSYSHKDRRLFEEFKTMLAPAIQAGDVNLWDDQEILPGEMWKEEIQNALASACVAVLLVSPNFLASHFITEKELPPLLKATQDEGVTISWIYLSSCLFEQTEIASYQALHDISRPLDLLSRPQRQAVLAKACAKLIQANLKPITKDSLMKDSLMLADEPLNPVTKDPRMIQAEAMSMSRFLQLSLKNTFLNSFFSDASRYQPNESCAALLVYAALPVTTWVDFRDGKIIFFNTDKHLYWDYKDPDLRRAMVTDYHTAIVLAELLVGAHAKLAEASSQNAASFDASQAYYFINLAMTVVGDTLLQALLFFEKTVVDDAIRIASNREMGQAVDVPNELDKLRRVISQNFDERLSTSFGGMRGDEIVKSVLLSIAQAFSEADIWPPSPGKHA